MTGSGEFDLQNFFSHELAPIPTYLLQNISESMTKDFSSSRTIVSQ